MKLTFKTKIFFICALWSLLLIACAMIVERSQTRQTQIQAEFEHSNAVTAAFNSLLTITINMETGIRGYLLSSDDSYLEPFNQNEAKFDEQARAAHDLMATEPPQVARLEEIMKTKQDWITGPAVEEMMARRKLDRKMISPEDFMQTFKTSKGKLLTDQIRQQIHDALSFEQTRTAALALELTASAKRVRVSILFGIPLSILFGLCLVVFCVIAASRDIQSLITRLMATAAEIESASTSLTRGGEHLTQSTQQVNTSVQETSAAVTEISSITESNAATAQHSIQEINDCLQATYGGRDAVQATRSAIVEIDGCGKRLFEKVTENNQKLSNVTRLMHEIQSKTKIINDIVFQTKLLSFNAAVESARAGEHGKGFSVVADEMSKLANISGTAANEINLLLTSSASEAEATVSETVESMGIIAGEIRERISLGFEKSDLSQEKLSDIEKRVEHILSLMKKVIVASEEQVSGIDGINKAIHLIDISLKDQTSVVGTCSQTSTNLRGFSNGMHTQIEKLELMFGSAQNEKSEPRSTSLDLTNERQEQISDLDHAA